MPELIPAEPGTAEWHAFRRLGVTATDIVTILGLSHWDSPYSLFWRKMGQVPDVEDNDRFRLGRELEPYIANWWAEETGVLIRKAPGMYARPVVRDGGLYRADERPWQLATLDRIRYEGNGDISEPIELKSWADMDRRSWDDGPPPTVRAQVLWQMDVMDAAAGHVGVLFLPSGEFRSYTIEHDAGCTYPDYPDDGGWLNCDVCKDVVLMRAAGFEFMRRLNLELAPPDPDSSAATLAAVRARFAKAPGKEAEIDAFLYQSWHEAKEIADYYDDEASYMETLIREQAQEASILTVDGVKVITRVVSDAQVKAHIRHVDYYRRVTVKGDGSE